MIPPNEIFKNDYQMEQWVWINFLNNSEKKLDNNCSFRDYLDFLNKNILVLTTKQIGYLWNRSSNFYYHNWSELKHSHKKLYF